MAQNSIENILKAGELKIKVKRSSMLQFITFHVKSIPAGNFTYPELYSERVIDLSELIRVANEVGLPVEAHGVRAFPDGKGAKDFINR